MTIDWNVALGFVDRRQDLLLELIDIFFIEHAELIPRITQAIESTNAAELQLYAHRVKGCLRYFGESKAELAQQLELLGRSGSLNGAPQLLPQLRTAIDEMLPEMRASKQEHQQP